MRSNYRLHSMMMGMMRMFRMCMMRHGQKHGSLGFISV